MLASSHALAPGGWIIRYGADGQQLVNTRRPIGDRLPLRPDLTAAAAMLASGLGQVSGIKWSSALQNHQAALA